MAHNAPPDPYDPLNQPPNQGGFPPNAGPYGYQGNPSPMGYQDPSQFGQPPYGGPNGYGPGSSIGRALLAFFIPGAMRRGGRRRPFRYAVIAFWLIVIGICLYVGFTTHHWVITCTGNNCGD